MDGAGAERDFDTLREKVERLVFNHLTLEETAALFHTMAVLDGFIGEAGRIRLRGLRQAESGAVIVTATATVG